jgi:hypothetical protein
MRKVGTRSFLYALPVAPLCVIARNEAIQKEKRIIIVMIITKKKYRQTEH